MAFHTLEEIRQSAGTKGAPGAGAALYGRWPNWILPSFLMSGGSFILSLDILGVDSYYYFIFLFG